MIIEQKAYKRSTRYLAFFFVSIFYAGANAAVNTPATQADCFASRKVEKACLEAEAKKEIALVSREKKIVTKRLGELGGMTLATYHQDDQIKADYEKICGAIKKDVVEGKYELFPDPEIKSSDVGPYEFAKAMRQEYVRLTTDDEAPHLDAIDSFLKVGPSPTTDHLTIPMWMYVHNDGMAFVYFSPEKSRVYVENNYTFHYEGKVNSSNQIMNERQNGGDDGYETIQDAVIAVAKIRNGLYGIQTGQYAIDFNVEERATDPDYVPIKYYELRGLGNENFPQWKIVKSGKNKVTKVFVSGENGRYAVKSVVAIFPFDPPWENFYDKAASAGIRLVTPENFYGRPCLWYLP